MAGGVVWTHRPPSRLRLVLHQIEDSWCFYWSWRSCSLSFRGKALVNNALALSRVWYVASLIHMPGLVEKELSRLVFSFFWSGKRELVSRSTVVQSHLFGGFSVVNVKFKVYALLGQWVKRFASSPMSLLSCRCGSRRLSVFPLLLCFLGLFRSTLGSCRSFIRLFCPPGVASMVLFLPPTIPWLSVSARH